MVALTLRSVKGSELTAAEIDANFTNLNTDKLSSTADNYMAGSLGIGAVPVTGYKVLSYGNWTGATTFYVFASQGSIQSDVTAAVYTYRSAPNTAAASFTLANIVHYIAEGGVVGVGSAITTQQGFSAASSLTTATNNYGFFGNIAAGTGRYNLYMNGTADNYLAGKLGIGGVPTTAASSLEITKAMTGATTVYGVANYATVQSGVTTGANYFWTQGITQAAAFTLANLRHFYANQGTIGAGSTVTNQFGFVVDASLTGATNNYSFYGNIAAAAGRYNLYMAGTASNYMGGPLITAGLKATSAAAPTLASATTIAPTTQIAFVSGVAPVVTITVPSPISLGGGQITLIPTGIFTTTTAGNIALASTAIVGKALIMTYDATTTKWYPSY